MGKTTHADGDPSQSLASIWGYEEKHKYCPNGADDNSSNGYSE